MSFEQAAIKVEREREFEELKAVIHRAFRAEKVEMFLKRLNRASLRIRNWDAVLDAGVFGRMDKAAESASSLYDALTISDQAQIREFYLFRVEEVDPALRTKFHKIYQYY
jgi:hypothetical protein